MAEKQVARRAADVRRSEQAEIRQAVQDALVSGTFQRVERLPVELRERAVRVAERQAAELEAQAGSDRVREAIRRRLERIRQLAAEPSDRPAESTEPVAVE